MAATLMNHPGGMRAEEDILRVTVMSRALHAFNRGRRHDGRPWAAWKAINSSLRRWYWGFHGIQSETMGQAAASYMDGKKQLANGRNPPAGSCRYDENSDER
ncbi:acetate kinase [Marssonina coronariae]|uniref:Acetate kinase n=1 Tax=Diplocarpon coronariae TaxID=2795749 RepID=A0A218YT67_9HELO|nr:acetate kinase [Marssonina coronariae]